jgi:hypothetical protein
MVTNPAKASARHKKMVSMLGFFAPFHDDWIDETKERRTPHGKFSREQLKQWQDRFIGQAYQALREKINPSACTYRLAYKMHLAQIASRECQLGRPGLENLQKTTRMKGGYAIRLTCSLANIEKDPEKVRLYMAYGKFLQLLDDIFDVFQDREKGISTLANSLPHWGLVKKELANTFHELKNSGKGVCIPNPRRFMHYSLLLYLAGTGMIAQLTKSLPRPCPETIPSLPTKMFAFQWYRPPILKCMWKAFWKEINQLP